MRNARQFLHLLLFWLLLLGLTSNPQANAGHEGTARSDEPLFTTHFTTQGSWQRGAAVQSLERLPKAIEQALSPAPSCSLGSSSEELLKKDQDEDEDEDEIDPLDQALPHLNAAIVVANDYFHIYRSAGLGKKGWEELTQVLKANHLPCPGLDIYVNKKNYETTVLDLMFQAKEKVQSTFAKVTGKKLQPSSQVHQPFAAQEDLLSQGGASHDVCLPLGDPDQSSELADSIAEELSSRSAGSSGSSTSPLPGFVFVHALKDPWVYLNAKGDLLRKVTNPTLIRSGDQVVESEGGRESFYKVLEYILTFNGAVDFHCIGGMHRTGMIALMIRNLQGGQWTAPHAKQIQVTRKVKHQLAGAQWPVPYASPVVAQLRNAAEVEYVKHNHTNFRQENLDAVAELSQDKRFECLKSAFGPYLNGASDLPALSKAELWKKCSAYEKETRLAAALDRLEGWMKYPHQDEKVRKDVSRVPLLVSQIQAAAQELQQANIDAPMLEGILYELRKRCEGIVQSHYKATPQYTAVSQACHLIYPEKKSDPTLTLHP
jgi:hypothetical protein